jgi:hypothetical protein
MSKLKIIQNKGKEITYSKAVKAFFDNNLKPGMSYLSEGKEFTTVPPDAKLLYQDSTASSAGYFFSDIFLTKEKVYLVRTEIGHARFIGDNPEDHKHLVDENCSSLEEVLDVLSTYFCPDPNTSGDMCIRFAEKYPKMREMTPEIYDCYKALDFIKEDPLLIRELYENSLKGIYRYNKSKSSLKQPRGNRRYRRRLLK